MAPDFLVGELDYGILDEVVRPTSEGDPATVVEVRTRGGRDLTVVYATHLLTAADIQARQTTARAKIAEPRDEHSRPLRLIYGFVSSDARITQPAEADLHFAWDAALKVYRRFLENENTVGVAPARSFALHSRVISKPMATAGSSPRQPSSPHAVSVSTSLRSGARGIAVLPRAVPWFAAAANHPRARPDHRLLDRWPAVASSPAGSYQLPRRGSDR
jgi:hypothetical protein